MKAIEQALKLRQEQKDAISVLYERHGWTYKEIARALRLRESVINLWLTSIEYKNDYVTEAGVK